jgi:hypothetical protein
MGEGSPGEVYDNNFFPSPFRIDFVKIKGLLNFLAIALKTL